LIESSDQYCLSAGKFLGELFRRTSLHGDLIDAYPEFVFSYKGALAYVGASRGIADLNLKSLWDIHPMDDGHFKVEGTSAFAIWRSLYFSKLLSSRNQAQVAFDWIKSWLFGRDIATPALKSKSFSRSDPSQ
jgi:NADH dehydrogenase FAD-containing subunit